MSEWVSVKDRLPEDDSTVVAWLGKGSWEYKLASCVKLSDGDRRWFYNSTEFFYGKDGVSHWMPLPPPPHLESEAIEKEANHDHTA